MKLLNLVRWTVVIVLAYWLVQLAVTNTFAHTPPKPAHHAQTCYAGFC